MPPNKVSKLHHFAYRCRDAEETRVFYEDVLGLPLVHVVRAEKVSTGETAPFAHIFFQLRDGSHIAFFDLGDDVKALPSPNTPDWVNHIAFEMDTVEEVRAAKERLEAAGVAVVGMHDHHFINSIYFFDPNGVRLELTVKTESEDYMKKAANEAHAALQGWTRDKAARRHA